MSGIGEYIHYTRSGYLAHGITKDGTPSNNAQTIFNLTKQNIQTKLILKNNIQDFSVLETELERLLFSKEENLQEVESQKLETLLGTTVLKWANTAFGASGVRKRALGKLRPKLDTVVKYRDRAKRILDNLEKGISAQNIKDIQAQKQQLQELYILLNTMVEQHEKENQGSLRSTIKGSQFTNEINRINDLLRQIDAHTKTQAIGSYLEGIIGSVDDRLTLMEDQVTNNLITEIMTGTRSTLVNQGAKVSESLNDAISHIKIGNDDFKVSMTGDFKKVSQGKMDVNLLYNGNQYRVTAKNYNLKYNPNVHLAKDQRLFQILQRSTNDEKFVNHFLNILTTHARGRGKHPLYKEALGIGRFVIAADAIAGIAQVSGMANTLILADRSRKKIKIIPINNLLENVENYFRIVGYDNIHWLGHNKWVGKNKSVMSEEMSRKRIANLIVSLHKIKITTTLNGNKLFV